MFCGKGVQGQAHVLEGGRGLFVSTNMGLSSQGESHAGKGASISFASLLHLLNPYLSMKQ